MVNRKSAIPELRWMPLSANGMEPRRAYNGDAGYDLFVSIECVIPSGSTVTVHTDVAVELPSGIWGLLVPRSSSLGVRGLHVMTGIIDNGYRGELSMQVYNLNAFPVPISVGERLAQLIPMPLMRMALVQADTLASSERGNGGYGSSGR